MPLTRHHVYLLIGHLLVWVQGCHLPGVLPGIGGCQGQTVNLSRCVFYLKCKIGWSWARKAVGSTRCHADTSWVPEKASLVERSPIGRAEIIVDLNPGGSIFLGTGTLSPRPWSQSLVLLTDYAEPVPVLSKQRLPQALWLLWLRVSLWAGQAWAAVFCWRRLGAGDGKMEGT